MGFWAAGDSVTTVVCLTDDTGAASDADSLPTGTLYLNGVANGAAVTVTDIGTGRYRVTWTNPGANGNVVSVVLAFTMGGIASQATIWEERLAATPYSGTPPTPPTAVEIRQEMDSNSTQLAAIATDAGDAASAAEDNQTTLTGLKTANITATQWKKIRAGAAGERAQIISAEGVITQEKLYDADGTLLDTDSA